MDPLPRAPAAPIGNRLRVLAFVLLVLLGWTLRPLVGVLVFAGYVVLVADGPFERMVRALRGRRSWAAALATIGVCLLVLAPLATLVALASGELRDRLPWIQAQLAEVGGLAGLKDRLPESLRSVVPESLDWSGALTWVAPRAPRAISSAGWMATELLLFVVTVFYLFRDGSTLAGAVERLMPLQVEETRTLLGEFRRVALGLFRGSFVTALFHGGAAALGYLFFGLSGVALLGLLSLLTSFVPLVGTGLVSGPVIVWLYLSGHTGKAVGLLLWSLAVVGAGDYVLRPLVSKGHMALPRALVFLTMFGGIRAFGAQGLLLGPLLGSLAVAALGMLRPAEQRAA